MISYTGLFVTPTFGISVILSVLCIVTSTATNGLSFQYLDKENTILQLACDGRGVVAKDANLSITIYSVATMNTLAQMRVGECPWTVDNGVTGNIYTLICLPHHPDPLPVLKMIVTDVEKSSARKFGCNITDLQNTTGMPFITWTITAHKRDPTTLVTEQRAAESRLNPLDKPNQLADSYFPIYAMGFVILSLALGLAAALCYIGMQMLKSRRSDSVSGDGRSGGPDDNADAYEEAVGDSGHGPDGGCERSLFCPNGTYRRPSYHDYSEPMSPTPSAISDYVGIDFLQFQLSDKLVTAPNLRLPRNDFNKKPTNSDRRPSEKITENYIKETLENNMYIKIKDIRKDSKCNEIKKKCPSCRLDCTIVVFEYTTTEILECPDDDGVISFLRSYHRKRF